jgi:hypothetical protein
VKKCFVVSLFLVLFICLVTISYANLVENIDYSVDFQEKTSDMAAILHINFISIFPDIIQVEEIVKQQLKKYGSLIIKNNKLMSTLKTKRHYKNIIGSAWYINDLDPANPIKIKFKEDLGAYVWLGKTKTIVSFPQYLVFLKNNINKNTK